MWLAHVEVEGIPYDQTGGAIISSVYIGHRNPLYCFNSRYINSGCFKAEGITSKFYLAVPNTKTMTLHNPNLGIGPKRKSIDPRFYPWLNLYAAVYKNLEYLNNMTNEDIPKQIEINDRKKRLNHFIKELDNVVLGPSIKKKDKKILFYYLNKLFYS